MTSTPTLHWLPEPKEWRAAVGAFRKSNPPSWDEAVRLAGHNLDFVKTAALDQAVQAAFAEPPKGLVAPPVRLAMIGSATMTHLQPSLRVAGLRRGLHVTIYENDYGQYLQELHDSKSALHRFKPDTVLIALDAYHLTAGVDASMSQAESDAAFDSLRERLLGIWKLARGVGAKVLHQAPLPVIPDLIGSNEQRLPGSRAAMVARLNAALRPMADAAGVAVVGLDARAAVDGLLGWHDAALWHRAKQEVSPATAPVYGELVARLMAASLGRSAKCLVLDLDNTLWGGVIGDDGMDGIILGQGSALGEAFASVQDYAREQSRRGVILAVCSKNDEANAVEPFEKHPEMVLKRTDIACFVANWSDKASNIREIAKQLNIGLDSLVFLDDNPFERNLVRAELPMVAVPEVPEDPALVPRCLADAGYFEALTITPEDLERGRLYQSNLARESLRASVTDMDSYLRDLQMQLVWSRFDSTGLARTTQLINKTNQFNLTTRRYSEDEVASVMNDARAFGLQLRLLDRFGDNGIIGIVIGRRVPDDPEAVIVDTWLMSCRVLGRGVEAATLALVVMSAKALGARRLIGAYVPTKKNGMVREHFPRLGFANLSEAPDGSTRWLLALDDFTPPATFIEIVEA
jgi:FkbH-like protein